MMIRTRRKSRDVTRANTKNYREQMHLLGFSFDRSREENSADPADYKWTQWIFIKLFEHGLVYKAEMPRNCCSSCKVDLANEEVVNGHCEGCGIEVTRRQISSGRSTSLSTPTS